MTKEQQFVHLKHNRTIKHSVQNLLVMDATSTNAIKTNRVNVYYTTLHLTCRYLLRVNGRTPAAPPPHLVSQFLLFSIGLKSQLISQQSIHYCLSEIPFVPAQNKLNKNSIKKNNSLFCEYEMNFCMESVMRKFTLRWQKTSLKSIGISMTRLSLVSKDSNRVYIHLCMTNLWANSTNKQIQYTSIYMWDMNPHLVVQYRLFHTLNNVWKQYILAWSEAWIVL